MRYIHTNERRNVYNDFELSLNLTDKIESDDFLYVLHTHWAQEREVYVWKYIICIVGNLCTKKSDFSFEGQRHSFFVVRNNEHTHHTYIHFSYSHSLRLAQVYILQRNERVNVIKNIYIAIQ